MEPIFFILLGASAYVGWNIGANDTANCIGTTVGSGLLSFKKAVILVAAFAILGAMLQGHHVMHTIGKGIVKSDLNYLSVCVALICSGFFVTLATFFRIPTSTSQAIVGGVVGIGLAVGAEIDFSKLILIAESWIICPILVMVVAFGLMHLIRLVLRRFETGSLLSQHAFGLLAILSACYVAYSMGANNAGNAVGPVANLNIFPPRV
ncbi:MAG: anion permease, partial [Deltaproteobacteria bacterium]|nr:anion permease [Deltaproteobacteria bacterium]